MSVINVLIVIFACISYWMGFSAMFKKGYKPNLFSRFVWFGLALNNAVSVISLHNQTSTVILATITFLGSLLIFIGSLLKGERVWHIGETISAIFLVVSLLIWIFTRMPILNLSIGLIAHFIGSIPTVIRVINDPKTENIPFWFFFDLASFLTLFSIHTGIAKDYIFALYFFVFDGIVLLLCLRRYIKNNHVSEIPNQG